MPSKNIERRREIARLFYARNREKVKAKVRAYKKRTRPQRLKQYAIEKSKPECDRRIKWPHKRTIEKFYREVKIEVFRWKNRQAFNDERKCRVLYKSYDYGHHNIRGGNIIKNYTDIELKKILLLEIRRRITDSVSNFIHGFRMDPKIPYYEIENKVSEICNKHQKHIKELRIYALICFWNVKDIYDIVRCFVYAKFIKHISLWADTKIKEAEENRLRLSKIMSKISIKAWRKRKRKQQDTVRSKLIRKIKVNETTKNMFLSAMFTGGIADNRVDYSP